MTQATPDIASQAESVNRNVASPRRRRSRRAVIVPLLCAIQVVCAGAAARAQAPEPAGEGAAPQGATTVKGDAAAHKPPLFADDTLMYVAGPWYRNPHVTTPSEPDGADILRQAIEFKHIDTWKYGHNLVEIIMRKSNEVEPAAGGGTGVLALYGVLRSGVGINRVAGRPLVAAGPLREIAIEVGANLESKNSEYAPEERTLYFGPNLQFRFLSGFLNVGLHVRKEWNHNGTLGVNESYDVNFNVEPVWHFPFRVGGAQLAFDGFADYNTSKGKDGFGAETHPEFILRPQLKLDISRVFGQKTRILEAGVGFEYWHNTFGKSAELVPGARELTPIFTLTVHLPINRSAD